MKIAISLLVIPLLLSACSLRHPTDPNLHAGGVVRHVPAGYWTPNFSNEERANTLYDGFGAAYHPEDLRYQYAILQDARVQQQINDMMSYPTGYSRTVHEFGNVAVDITLRSGLYWFSKTKSNCRQLEARWYETPNGNPLQSGPQLFCQIGANLEWLPVS